MASVWSKVGAPTVAQLDNHTNFRDGIQPAHGHFGPVVATCLDLRVTPQFIPLREPWRNGVVEHFNDVWDKLLAPKCHSGLDHLRAENNAFIEFHTNHHHYAAPGGQPERGPSGTAPKRARARLPHLLEAVTSPCDVGPQRSSRTDPGDPVRSGH